MKRFLLIAVAVAGSTFGCFAADEPSAKPRADEMRMSYPGVELQEVLSAVTRNTGKQFLVAAGVPLKVVIGPLDLKSITYPILLTVLKNNGLTGVEDQGMVDVIPATNAKISALPVLNDDVAETPDDQWVTRVVHLDNAEATYLVAVLRPMMSQAGHMAALGGANAVLLTDTYGNVKTLTGLLHTMDRLPMSPPRKTASQ